MTGAKSPGGGVVKLKVVVGGGVIGFEMYDQASNSQLAPAKPLVMAWHSAQDM